MMRNECCVVGAVVFFALCSSANPAETAVLAPVAQISKTNPAQVPCDELHKDKLDRFLVRPQDAYLWCWAASADMVTEHLKRRIKQCQQAEQYFCRTDCCELAYVPAACDCTGWPVLDPFAFEAEITRAPLSWDALRKELSCSRRPVLYAYDRGSDGHMVVIIGYEMFGSDSHLIVYDPSPLNIGGEETVTYAEYAGRTHWRTYHSIRNLRKAP